jgi:hypothetical protein
MIFQVAAITPKEVKIHFAKGPLELFKRLQTGPQFSPNPLELLDTLQCGPRGARGGAACRIPTRPTAGMAGEVGEKGLGVA